MARSVYLRRFMAVLLCCVLAFHSSLPVAKASDPVTAATLAVTGGQLAGGALAGEAGAASLAGPVGVVVGLTLGALGVNAYVSKAAQDAGKTRTRFVLDNLVIWGYKAGYAKEQLYKKIAQGISVAADGTIQLSHDVARIIEQFGNWLFTQEGAVVPSISSSLPDSMDVGNMTFPIAGAGVQDAYDYGFTSHWNFTIVDSTSVVLLCLLTTGPYITFVSKSPFSVVHGSNNVSHAAEKRNSTYYYSVGIFHLQSGRTFPSFSSKSAMYDYFNANNVWNEPALESADEVFTGTPEAWVENKDVLNPSAEDTPIVLNPDLLNPIIDSLTEGQQATMSIIDYLQALQDTWDHALDDVQTAIGTITDTLTGIEEQIEITTEAIKNPTITNPDINPDTTPILNPSVVDPESVVPGFSFPLDEIFPFCIPFDVVAALELFDVPAEAPSLHVHWVLPYNIVFDFDLDLSAYDDIAALLRVMETILFAVGLAVATRSLFIRS